MKGNQIDDLTLIKSLGKGSYGEVFLSTKEGRKEYFATKKMDRKKTDEPGFKKYFDNEIKILTTLKHPNIVKLEELKKTKNYYYLVMEYVNGGSLGDCLESYKRKNGKAFPEEIVQYLMRQIVETIKYIHGLNIIHRDLKLDNIMVNFENEADKKNLNMMRAQIKIIDFGFAMYLSKSSLTFTALGSPINMDPIILQKFTKRGIDRDKVGYDFKADIWSLGTICYEMLIGEAVFNAETLNELVRKVENGSYSIPTCVSREVVSFLNGMLQYKGEKRLSAEELSKHPFLTKNIKNFSKINTRKVSKKINNQNLNINIKKNQTIWAIFNEDDEKQLAKIKGNCSSERPISEEKKKKKKKDNNKQINYNNQQYNKNNNNNNIKINPVENQNKKGVNQKKVNENPGMQQKNNKEQKIFIKPKPELQPLIREKNSFDDFDFDSIIKFPANMDFPFEKINNPGYNINRINNMQQYRINNMQQYRINNLQQHSIFDDDEDMEVCSIY